MEPQHRACHREYVYSLNIAMQNSDTLVVMQSGVFFFSRRFATENDDQKVKESKMCRPLLLRILSTTYHHQYYSPDFLDNRQL